MSLLSTWDNNNLPTQSGVAFNDVWAWTSPTGKEYAILGSLGYTYFIEVSNPAAPVVRDSVAGRFSGCIHRDFKTFRHYAYGVGDEGNSSLQVFDLSYLPDSVHVVYDSDNYFQRCHNIYIDTLSGRLYAAGCNTQINGIIVLDLAANPENPTLSGTYNLGSYTHDIHVRGDTGYLSNGYNGLAVYDFTIPGSPTPIGALPTYPRQGYNHSSHLTENGDYLVMCDETWGMPSKMVDVRNLQNISVTTNFMSALLYPDTASIPHNPFVIGDYLLISHYHDGIQLFDIQNPVAPVQTAWYDTEPSNTNYNGYKGAWGVYPFLPSGIILGSDVLHGLFVLRPNFPFPYPLASGMAIQHVTCFGGNNGVATASPSGGTPPYTYLWSNGQTGATATGLSAGTFTVTITDNWGNPFYDTVQINQPSQILLGLSTTGESCPGTADGSASVSPSGGTPGYTYTWSTGDQISTIHGLTAGTYSVTVTDTLGCPQTLGVTIPLLATSPLANAGPDTTICSAAHVLNGLAQAGATGMWQLIGGSGNIQNPSSQQTLASNLGPGANTFTWIVSSGPCTGKDTVTILVSAAAFVDAGTDTLACGNSLTLNADDPAPATGTWAAVGSVLAFTSANDPQATAFGFMPGSYTLTWTITDLGCTRSDTLQVTAADFPAAAFSFGGTGGTINFTDNSLNASSWFWDFGDGTTSTLQNPTHPYTSLGTFTVCETVANMCGSDTTCRQVTVTAVGRTEPEAAWMQVRPNPTEGEVVVEIAGVQGLNGQLRLLNLQGQSVAAQEVLLDAGQWGGRFDWSQLPAGLYFLELRVGETQQTVKVVLR